MLQPVTNLPDHGLGRLGQVAHGILAAGLQSPPGFPQLYLGYNTMANPPLRLPSYLGFDADESGWHACGRDMVLYLRAINVSLRAQALPSLAGSVEAYHRIARITRVDSIALLYRTVAEDTVVALALDRQRTSIMLWAPPWTERNVVAARPRQDAFALALQHAGIRDAFPDPPDTELQLTDGAVDAELASVLGDILDGQYTSSQAGHRLADWSRTTFPDR